MKWYEHLYLSDSISQRKAKRIQWRLKHNVGVCSVYVIAFATFSDGILDVIPAKELRQKGYPKQSLYIIGMAKEYDEAIELVADIVNETYQNTQAVDVYTYLMGERRSAT